MKRVYWRPPTVSRGALGLIASLALGLLFAVERFQVVRQQPWYTEKIAAAQLAQHAMDVIKAEKARRGIRLDLEDDPTGSGMIGEALTAVTANTGYLTAKQKSVDPNFAAVMVHLLKKAKVEPGDLVAIGISGSFPALNTSTFAAVSVLEARPIVVASVSGSEWGANHVDYLWIDMERTLFDQGVFKFRSVAASRGGIDDRGYGISKEGRALLDAALDRNGVTKIEARSLADSIDKRMQAYDEQAAGKPIRVYVNVGGGTASVGTAVGKRQFKPGLNLERPRGEARLLDSVMLRFIERDVPVIHVSNVEDIAKMYGLRPIKDGKLPAIGDGQVYAHADYNRWLAGGGLLVLLAAMLVFIRLEVGFRILKGSSAKKAEGGQPQQMV